MSVTDAGLVHLEAADQTLITLPLRNVSYRRWAGASEGADQALDSPPRGHSGH